MTAIGQAEKAPPALELELLRELYRYGSTFTFISILKALNYSSLGTDRSSSVVLPPDHTKLVKINCGEGQLFRYGLKPDNRNMKPVKITAEKRRSTSRSR